MTNSNVERAARIIAAAVVHGKTGDPALEAAQSLDELGLLAPSIGRSRPEPSPSALAVLAECRRAKNAAYTASLETAGMPGEPAVTAAGGEVQFVVHPQRLADWQQWTQTLGVGDALGDSTGTSMVVRFTYSGVRARLVGVGVPAMYGSELPARLGRRTAVRT